MYIVYNTVYIIFNNFMKYSKQFLSKLINTKTNDRDREENGQISVPLFIDT